MNSSFMGKDQQFEMMMLSSVPEQDIGDIEKNGEEGELVFFSEEGFQPRI